MRVGLHTGTSPPQYLVPNHFQAWPDRGPGDFALCPLLDPVRVRQIMAGRWLEARQTHRAQFRSADCLVCGRIAVPYRGSPTRCAACPTAADTLRPSPEWTDAGRRGKAIGRGAYPPSR